MLRKAEREQLEKRIIAVIRSDPRPAPILAERFGASCGTVNRLAKKIGIELPTSEYLSPKEARKLKRRPWSGKDWGYLGE